MPYQPWMTWSQLLTQIGSEETHFSPPAKESCVNECRLGPRFPSRYLFRNHRTALSTMLIRSEVAMGM
jgi:hypothetical protein